MSAPPVAPEGPVYPPADGVDPGRSAWNEGAASRHLAWSHTRWLAVVLIACWLASTTGVIWFADSINTLLPTWPVRGAAAYVLLAFVMPVFYLALVLVAVVGMHIIEGRARSGGAQS